MTCPTSLAVAAATAPRRHSDSPWADRPSTPVESIAPPPCNGSTTAKLIEARADRITWNNGRQRQRFIDKTLILARQTYSEDDA